MSTDDIKELKAITLQILKNQTLMIAHLVQQQQLQAQQKQPQQQQAMMKAVKTEPMEHHGQQQAAAMKRKANSDEKGKTAMMEERNARGRPVGKRRTFSIGGIVEGGTEGKKDQQQSGVVAKQGRNCNITLPAGEHYCAICVAGVRTEHLVQHIWEHIVKKVMAMKGSVDNPSIYSFVCDVKDCRFRTNKFSVASAHADKHPDVERNQVVLDNRENTEPLFLATLAQCYDRMSSGEKDEVYQKRFE